MTSRSHLTAEHLSAIRQHADWRQLFKALRISKDPKKSKDHDWWGKSPFKPDERTPSFHINDRGWYCHSTDQGGGAIELVQRLHGISCYEAGRWLLEQGVSQIAGEVRKAVEASVENEQKAIKNPPIRQNLRKQLSTGHPAFVERSIPPTILEELGAGYLDRPPRKNGRPDQMNRRLVFQIRGLWEDDAGRMQPVVLGHIGRATTASQEQQDGKWWTYAGFNKSLELYNVDLAVLDDEAVGQAKDTNHVLVVEGPFDVAKLHAAGIRNVVATFGAALSPAQLSRLDLIYELVGVNRFLFFYDRDNAGLVGAAKALEAIAASGLELEADAFDWNRTWMSAARGEVGIPPSIADPADFSVEQLRWLRLQGLI